MGKEYETLSECACMLCRPSTGPSMNPARTIGAALATGKYKDIWIYLLAPPLGAIGGAATYTLIKPFSTSTDRTVVPQIA